MKIENLERINNMQAIESVQLFMGSLANKRIHMYWVYSFCIRIIFHNTTDSAEHMMHGFPKVFAAMRSDKN